MEIKKIIQLQVEKYYNLKPGILKAKYRKNYYCEKRHIAMFLMVNYYNETLMSAAYYFKYANHSSASSACDKIAGLIKYEKNLKKDIEVLKKIINLSINKKQN